MDDFFRLNNRILSAKSVLVTVSAVPYTGILAMDYGDNLESEDVHGMNRDGTPLGDTSGKYSVERFTMTFLKDVFQLKFQTQLVALSLAAGAFIPTIGAARFPIMVQYSEFGQPPCIDVIGGARVLSTKDDVQEGTGKAVTVVGLKALSLSRNGITLYDRSRSIP